MIRRVLRDNENSIPALGSDIKFGVIDMIELPSAINVIDIKD